MVACSQMLLRSAAQFKDGCKPARALFAIHTRVTGGITCAAAQHSACVHTHVRPPPGPQAVPPIKAAALYPLQASLRGVTNVYMLTPRTSGGSRDQIWVLEPR